MRKKILSQLMSASFVLSLLSSAAVAGQALIPSQSVLTVSLADSMGTAISMPISLDLNGLSVVWGTTQYPDSNTGKYVFVNPPQGTYNLHVPMHTNPMLREQYYNPSGNTTVPSHGITVGFADTLSIVVRILSVPLPSSWVNGTIADSMLMGIPGVKVELFDTFLTQTPFFTVTTDSSGRFYGMNLPQSKFFIRAMAPGYPVQWYDMGLPTATPAALYYGDGAANTISMNLSQSPALCNSQIQIILTDSGNVPITSAQVSLVKQSEPSFSRAFMNNGNGMFSVSSLKRGSYGLRISAPGFPLQYYDVSVNTTYQKYYAYVNGTDTVRLTSRLIGSTTPPPTGPVLSAIILTLSDSLNTPVTNAKIDLLKLNETSFYKPCINSGNGMYTGAPLSSGSYALRITVPGFPQQYYHPAGNTSSQMNYQYVTGTDTIRITSRLLLNLGGTTSPPDTGTSSGHAVVVVSLFDSTNAMVQSAKVDILKQNDPQFYRTCMYTGNGLYSTSYLGAGYFAIRIEVPGFPPQYYNPSGNTIAQTHYVNVNGMDTVRVSSRLIGGNGGGGTQPPPSNGYKAGIKGFIKNSTGSPLSGIEVMAVVADSAFYMQYYSRSDSSGLYQMNGVRPGNYVVSVRADSQNFIPQFYYQTSQRSAARVLKLDTTMVDKVDFVLRAGGMIIGDVKSVAGNPVTHGASINCQKINDSLWLNAKVDGSGSFSFKGLPTGMYRICYEGYDWFAADGSTCVEIQATEGSTVTLPTKTLERSGFLKGTIVNTITSLNNTDSISGTTHGGQWQLLLYPSQIPSRDTMIWPTRSLWVYSTSPDGFVLPGVPAGSWRCILVPGSKGSSSFDQSGSRLLAGPGFTFANNASTLETAPVFTVAAGDTAQAGTFTIRAGFAMDARLTFETGTTSNATTGNNARISLLMRSGNCLYQVINSYQMGNNRYEIPGLVSGSDYLIQAGAMGFPGQFWAASGSRMSPDSSWTFAGVLTQPLEFQLRQQPAGGFTGGTGGTSGKDGYTGYNGDPVSLYAEYDSTKRTIIHLRYNPQLGIDSVALFSKGRTGSAIKRFSCAVSTRGDTVWNASSEVNSSLRYAMYAYSKTGLYRSYPIDRDLREARPMPKDSIWADVFASPWGARVIWGGGRLFQSANGDSADLYRKDRSSTSWILAGTRPAWSGDMMDDQKFDAKIDSTKTIDYRITIRKSDGSRLASPVVSLTMNTSFFNSMRKGKTLRVGKMGIPGTYGNIQDAVNAASDTIVDEIQVFADTTYRENVIIAEKRVNIYGAWVNGKPPVISAKGGTAFTYKYVPVDMWWERPRIQGFKIDSANVGVRIESDAEVSQCLFVNTQTAIQMAPDSQRISQSVSIDPFLKTGGYGEIWNCTFIGKPGNKAGEILQGAVTDTSYKSGMIKPRLQLSTGMNIGRSVLVGYGGTKFPTTIQGNGWIDAQRSILWQTSAVGDSQQVRVNQLVTVAPQFTDNEFFFQSDSSSAKFAFGSYEPVGYDVWRNMNGGSNGGGDPGDQGNGYRGPGAVANFKKTITGLRSVALSWSPRPDSEAVNSYRIYRTSGDLSLWMSKDGQWQPNEALIPPMLPIDSTTTQTNFVDTTLTIGVTYCYFVTAVDTLKKEGWPNLSSTLPFSTYTTVISYDLFKSSAQRLVKANSWQMLGLPGLDTAIIGTGDRSLFRWDDARIADKTYGQYATTDRLRPGEGGWFFAPRDTQLLFTQQNFSKLAAGPKRYTYRLIRGNTGWSQISSPWPFPIAPAWLAGIKAYEWLPDSQKYQLTKVIRPWSSIWVYAPKDTSVNLDGIISTATGTALAKRAMINGAWQIVLSLVGKTSSDRLLTVGAAGTGEDDLWDPKPPQAFNGPYFYIVNTDTLAGAPRALQKSLATNASSRIVWPVSIAANASASQLVVDSRDNIPKGMVVYARIGDQIYNLNETDTIAVAPHAQAVEGVIVATRDPREVSLLSGKFSCSAWQQGRITHLKFVVPYSLSQGSQGPSPVRISLFNIKGAHVATLVNSVYAPGIYSVNWNAGNKVGRGWYCVRMTAGEFVKSMPVVIR